VGVGTFTSPSTLSRDTVFSSSTGGSKVSFSAASTLEVFVTQPSEQAVYINDATGKVEVFGNGTNTVAFTNVTSDLFTGNASAISAINASNISSGTISNARTTASDANGASTIVSRDANGSFTANVGTFTSISGNGVSLTAINASNISSGTLVVERGGTGATTLTGLVVGNGTSAMTTVTAPSGTVVGTTDTQTLTNKRVTNRTGSNGATTSGNITPTSDTADQYNITGLTGTSAIQIPSGTPTDAQRLSIRIKDNGTNRTLSWVTTAGGYRVIGTTLPLTTTANKTIYVGCVYNNADSFWDVVAVASEV
jgi:hypothetical protein